MNKKNGLVSGDMMQKQQFDTKTLRRLLSYMKGYKGQLIFVVVCILLSAIASAASALFLQSLIDDYIAPLLTSSAPVFTQLLKVLVVIGAVYLIGVLATLFYNRVMVTIAQGTLKKIRDEMFEKMQRLPIRAFDTRTHGDIALHLPLAVLICGECSAQVVLVAPGLTLAPSAKVFQSPDMTAWAVFSRFRRWGYLSLHQSSFFRLFHNHFWTPFQKFSRFFKAETSDLDTACCVTPSASAISLSVFPSMQYCRSL